MNMTTTTRTLGTIVEVPEGKTLFAVHTPEGTVFVVADHAGQATATLLHAEIPVLGSIPAR
jgi:hypothetical protein